VERVRLAIGALSGVEVEALRFGFDVAMRGSVAEAPGWKSRKWRARHGMPCGAGVSIAARMILAAVRFVSIAGDGWGRHDHPRIGGGVMCSVCGCGDGGAKLEGGHHHHDD
jgi:hypothetical protein